MLTITKKFGPYPAGHRQHTHEGHCKLIHGHDWSFDLTFSAKTLNKDGFVLDFGKMGDIKTTLGLQFDHTLLINLDDPEQDYFNDMHARGLANVCFMEAVSAEGIARWVMDNVGFLVECNPSDNDRVRLESVTVWEDNKNSATLSRK